MSNQERETMIIPGKPVKVDVSRVSGDTESGIRCELSLGNVESGDRLGEFMEKGGRVFITEEDNYMYVLPEEGDVEFPNIIVESGN